MIVEDEPASARFIHIAAESLGYDVIGICVDGMSALEIAEAHPLHIAVLDINLSGQMDGIQLAKKIRRLHQAALIFITGYSDPEVVQEALNLLPLAYLIKPVKLDDLKTALMLANQYLNQQQKSDKEAVWIDLPFSHRYNRVTRLLYHRTLPVELTPLERKLLSVLIDHYGHCVSSEQIIKSVWQDADATVDSLRTLIRRFHQKLGHDLIQNVYSKGYRIPS